MSMTIDEFETKRWRNEEGKYHREDGPAIEWSDGDRIWYLNGQLHREDGPAVELSDGSREWYFNGQRLSEYEFIIRTIGNFPEDLFEL